MANDATYRLIINAEQAIAELKKASAEAGRTDDALKRIDAGGAAFGSVVRGAGLGVAAVGALAAAATGAASALLDMGQSGQQALTVAAAFERLGGSADSMERLRAATKGMVDDTSIQQSANMAALFGIPIDKMEQLSKIAVGAALSTGESVGKLMGDLTTAASRMSPMIADNAGLTIKLADANDKYAKALGKTAEQLTAPEQKAAFLEAMIEGGKKQLALAEAIPQDKFAQGATAIANVKSEIETFVAQVLSGSGALEGLGNLLTQIKGVFDANKTSIEALITAGFGALTQVGGAFIQVLVALLPALTSVAQVIGQLAPALAAIAPLITALIELVKPLIDLLTSLTGVVADVATGLVEFATGAVRAVGDALGVTRDQLAEAAGGVRTFGSAAAAAAAQTNVYAAALRDLAAAAKGGAAPPPTDVAGQAAQMLPQIEQYSALTQAQMEEHARALADKATQGMVNLREVEAEQWVTATAETRARMIAENEQRIRLREEFFRAAMAEQRRRAGEEVRAADAQARNREQTALASIVQMQRALADAEETGVNTVAEAILSQESTYEGAVKRIQALEAELEGAIAARMDVSEERREELRQQLYLHLDQLQAAADAREQASRRRSASARSSAQREAEERKRAAESLAAAQLEAGRLFMDAETRAWSEIDERTAALAARLRAGGDGALAQAVESRVALAKGAKAAIAPAAQGLAGRMDDFSARAQVVAVQAQERLNRAKVDGALAAEKVAEASAREARAVAAGARLNEASAQATQTAFTGMLTGIITSSGSMRQVVMQNLGGLLGQLGTAFIAWATAEGNLLAGNPWLAIPAAIALQTAAGVISAIGSRGSGGGGGSAGASVARRTYERDREADRAPEMKIEQNFYGFVAPAEIAVATAQATDRGQELSARRRRAA